MKESKIIEFQDKETQRFIFGRNCLPASPYLSSFFLNILLDNFK